MLFTIGFVKPYLNYVRGNFFPAFINLFSKIFTKYNKNLEKELLDYNIKYVETEILGSRYTGENKYNETDGFKLVCPNVIENIGGDVFNKNNITNNNLTNTEKEISIIKNSDEHNFIYARDFNLVKITYEEDYGTNSYNSHNLLLSVLPASEQLQNGIRINSGVYNKKLVEYWLYSKSTNNDMYIVAFHDGDYYTKKIDDGEVPIYVEPLVVNNTMTEIIHTIQYEKEIVDRDTNLDYIRYFKIDDKKIFFYRNITGYGIQIEKNGRVLLRKEVIFENEILEKVFLENVKDAFYTNDNFIPVMKDGYFFFTLFDLNYELVFPNQYRYGLFFCYIDISEYSLDNKVNLIKDKIIEYDGNISYLNNFWSNSNNNLRYVNFFEDYSSKKLYVYVQNNSGAKLYEIEYLKNNFFNKDTVYFNDYLGENSPLQIRDENGENILAEMVKHYYRAPLSMYGYYNKLDRKDNEETKSYSDRLYKLINYPNLNGKLGIYNCIALINNLEVKDVNNVELVLNKAIEGEIELSNSEITFLYNDTLNIIDLSTIDSDNIIRDSSDNVIVQIHQNRIIFDEDYLKNNYANNKIEVNVKLFIRVSIENTYYVVGKGYLYQSNLSYELVTNIEKSVTYDSNFNGNVLKDLDYYYEKNWKWGLPLDVGGETNLVEITNYSKIAYDGSDVNIEVKYHNEDIYLPVPIKYPFNDVNYFKDGYQDNGGQAYSNFTLNVNTGVFNNINGFTVIGGDDLVRLDSNDLHDVVKYELYMTPVYIVFRKGIDESNWEFAIRRVDFFTDELLVNDFNNFLEGFIYIQDNQTNIYVNKSGSEESGYFETNVDELRYRLFTFNELNGLPISNEMYFIDDKYKDYQNPNIPLIAETDDNLIRLMIERNKVKFKKKYMFDGVKPTISDRSFIEKCFVNEGQFE